MAPGGYTVAKSTKDHIVVQDDDPAIFYTPENAWYKFGGDGGNYTVTNAYLAQFAYTFTGSEVWYYSDVNGDHGNFSVTLDGVSQGVKTSTAPSWKPQIVLFHATLEPGKHTLIVMSVNEHSNVTSLDYLACAAPLSALTAQDSHRETTQLSATSRRNALIKHRQSVQGERDNSEWYQRQPRPTVGCVGDRLWQFGDNNLYHITRSRLLADALNRIGSPPGAAPAAPSGLSQSAESQPPPTHRPAVAVYVGIALGVTALFLAISIAILVLCMRRRKRLPAKSAADSAWSQGIRPFPMTRPVQQPAPSVNLPEYTKVDRLR